LGVITEHNLDVFISDEFRENALRFGLDAAKGVISIYNKIRTGRRDGIGKIRAVSVPLFKTHFRDKYRIFFILGNGKIFFVCLARRDERTYNNVNKLILRITGEPIQACDWLTTNDSCAENGDESWDTRGEDREITNFLDSTTVKVFSVTKNALKTEELLSDFFKDEYQYHPQLKEQQNRTVEELSIPGDTQVWSVHGPAGSGKTTCAIHLAKKIFAYNPSSAILFVVPNERLIHWIEDTFNKNQIGCYRLDDETTGMDCLRKAYEWQKQKDFYNQSAAIAVHVYGSFSAKI